ncbi:MAG: Mut7-C RNAse domain-containing protein [Candidatus Thiodiazotropha sp.]
MPEVTLRFYEELNDFLPAALRKQDSVQAFQAGQSVKHLIEKLGVPHTEIEIVLVNGQSVAFDHLLREGDRISVYPMFESLDVSPLLKLRERPLRNPRFVADAHLGKLARLLRLVGFDTRFRNDAGDRALVDCSIAERRVLLSRDRALLMHRELTHGCYVHAIEPRRQLEEVVERFDLTAQMTPFSRCTLCNGALAPVDPGQIADRLPNRVRHHYNEFWLCRDCGQIYWKGSHYRQLSARVDALRNRGDS